jgi:hypothetical protein
MNKSALAEGWKSGGVFVSSVKPRLVGVAEGGAVPAPDERAVPQPLVARCPVPLARGHGAQRPTGPCWPRQRRQMLARRHFGPGRRRFPTGVRLVGTGRGFRDATGRRRRSSLTAYWSPAVAWRRARSSPASTTWRPARRHLDVSGQRRVAMPAVGGPSGGGAAGRGNAAVPHLRRHRSGVCPRLPVPPAGAVLEPRVRWCRLVAVGLGSVRVSVLWSLSGSVLRLTPNRTPSFLSVQHTGL